MRKIERKKKHVYNNKKQFKSGGIWNIRVLTVFANISTECSNRGTFFIGKVQFNGTSLKNS